MTQVFCDLSFPHAPSPAPRFLGLRPPPTLGLLGAGSSCILLAWSCLHEAAACTFSGWPQACSCARRAPALGPDPVPWGDVARLAAAALPHRQARAGPWTPLYLKPLLNADGCLCLQWHRAWPAPEQSPAPGSHGLLSLFPTAAARLQLLCSRLLAGAGILGAGPLSCQVGGDGGGGAWALPCQVGGDGGSWGLGFAP